jgi:hypothetical protein
LRRIERRDLDGTELFRVEEAALLDVARA